MVYSEVPKRSAFKHEGNGDIYQLNRLPFMTGDYNEEWLQEIIERCPELLPLDQFDGQYHPLICAGREIPVGPSDMRGFIDNLMISPSGAIAIVETKLFRNQESRRTVIAQIIDYAKELQKWDAEKLDKAISNYTYSKRGQAYRVIDLMCEKGYLTYSDEAAFTDAINSTLQEARFLLAIVGDGIRTGVVQLADFLNENGSAPYNIALVSLELYDDGDSTIIVPNLNTRTSVIERNYYSLTPVRVEAKPPQGYVKKPILSRQEFIRTFSENGGYDQDEVTEFVNDMGMINGLYIDIAPTEMTLKFRVGGRSCPVVTFCISGNKADFYVLPRKMKEVLLTESFVSDEFDSFLDFYRDYVDLKHCRADPYVYDRDVYYYAMFSEVLADRDKFIKALEDFALSIYED